MDRKKLEIYEENLNVAIQLLNDSHSDNEVIDRLNELVDDIGYVLENTNGDVALDRELRIFTEIGEGLVELPIREVLKQDDDDEIRVVVNRFGDSNIIKPDIKY